jgi:predicted nicotinamide N-methyase
VNETRLRPETATELIGANTRLMAPPHVPELSLHLADEMYALWHRTEEELAALGLPPPYWAFAWAGGQGLARYVLDHPGIVRGRTVLDFACGSGMVGIAAARAGAASVLATDADPYCEAALRLNSAANGVAVDYAPADLIGRDEGWDVVLAGDVFYDRVLAEQLVPWFETLSARGALVLIGDPGRSYLPKQNLEPLAVYEVPVMLVLEDAEVKRTTVWRFRIEPSLS